MVKKAAFLTACAFCLSAVLLSAGAVDSNVPPKAQDITIRTSEKLPVSGNVPVYDANGDPVRCIVITQPQKGELVFKNGTSYTYTPFAGKTGKDSFTCVFTDIKGGVGNLVQGNITIEPSASQSYSDMSKNPSHYSAIKLLEKGIMAGTKIGNNYYFSPKQKVTKGEFVLMLLAATGKSDFPASVNTGLKNDSKIPVYLKPAITVAKKAGIITQPNFDPDDLITRAQAVVYADRAVGIPDVKAYPILYKDKGEIPKYAAQSYINLSAYRMLDFYENKARPNKILTRDTAADLVWQVYKLVNSGNLK